MKIGVIADDFTGASDIALTLAEAGLSVSQFIGVPDQPADPALGAGVVALKSRTAPVTEAVSQSLAACDWLLAQGAQQIVLKVCSTFDSTSEGNIGPVLDALSSRLQARQILVCPAFPENGRSVFQGHLFVGDVLLNESGMQDHPLTPMTDADLRRVLGAQTKRSVGHLAALHVARGPESARAHIPDTDYIIADAIRDEDLMTLGVLAKNSPLLCGGSGIALGLPANFGASPATPDWVPIAGPGVVLSGSCSRATRGQVDRFRAIAPNVEVTAEAVMHQKVSALDLADWVLEQDQDPLIFSSADPDVVRAAQDRFGQAQVAEAIEGLFRDLARVLSVRGVRRIVVAGGETSGAVVSGLSAQTLRIGPRLAAGVPAVAIEGAKPMALALKSGNFGNATFFADALKKLGPR